MSTLAGTKHYLVVRPARNRLRGEDGIEFTNDARSTSARRVARRPINQALMPWTRQRSRDA
jgi:hypothetical protein